MSRKRNLTGCAVGVAALVACCVPAAANAQDCVDYASVTRWIGERHFAGEFRHGFYNCLVARGDTLVASDPGGDLCVLDASRPDDLRLLGQARVPFAVAEVHDLALDGDRLFVSGSLDTLHVVSLADPAAPSLVTSLATGLQAARLACRDHLLYVADANALAIWDVVEPASPRPLCRLSLPQGAVDLAVTDGLACVATATGLLTIDVADPAAPRLLGGYDDAELEGRAVALQDDRAYLAGRLDLLIIDLSDPAAPLSLGRAAGAGGDAIAVEGPWAAVTGHFGIGVRTIDVSDPLSPRFVSQGGPALREHGGAILRGGCLFTVAYDFGDGLPASTAVATYRLGAGARAELASTPVWSPPVYAGDIFNEAMSVVGDRARCLTSFGTSWPGQHSIDLVDLAAPGGAVVTGSVAVQGRAVAWRDDLACVAGTSLEVVDLSVATQPRVVASLPLPGVTDELRVGRPWFVGGRAVVRGATADGARDFIIALDDPLAPVLEAAVPSCRPDGAAFVTDGDLGYVYTSHADAGDSLCVLDLGDPAHPRRLNAAGFAWRAGETPQAVIAGGCLWISVTEPGGDVWLLGFSLADPAAPALVSRTAVPVAGLWPQEGDGWLVLSGPLGVHAVDIVDPARPVVVSLGADWSMAGPVAFRDGGCLIASWGRLYTATLPCRAIVPVSLSRFTVVAGARSVALAWGTAGGEPGEFALSARAGAEEWPVPYLATRSGFAARDASPRLAAGGTIVYTLRHRGAAGSAWTTLAAHAIELSAPPRPVALLAPYPNPFNPTVRVSFVLASAQRARVAIYDLAGRRVATLADGGFAAGRQDLVWQGIDDRGVAAASGSYLVRIEGETGLDQRRITLVR